MASMASFASEKEQKKENVISFVVLLGGRRRKNGEPILAVLDVDW
jgi:hypothetical protein